MKKITIFITLIALLAAACGKKDKASGGAEANGKSIGARYATSYINVTEQADPKSKKVRYVNDGEEVTALQEVNIKDPKTQKETAYFKIKTVDGKEGFAPKASFAEVIFVVSSSAVQAYNKPTLSSKVAGTLNKGAICYIMETKADWGMGSCYSATLEMGKKPVDVYKSWVRTSDTGFKSDPQLAQSALALRKAVKKSVELETPEVDAEKQEKLKGEIEKLLTEVTAKNDELNDKASALLAAHKGEAPAPNASGDPQ